ncbi:MAG TPA: hypothetical protein DCZ10_15760 [Pelotomaculum sp.]|nr:hypothetical protein [Pelotomaculum sp.]
MSYYTIPLTSDPSQNFTCTIPVDGRNITLRFRINYNDIAGYWWMSITDSSGALLIDSLPLLTGQNILGQYQYLGIGSAYLYNNGSSEDNPDNTNLGTDFLLIWGDSE